MSGYPMEHGTDVSSWNDVRDWGAVFGNGVRAVNVKVSQGAYYLNPLRGGQVHGARSAGLAVGGYHFPDPNSPLVAQTRMFVDEQRDAGLLDGGCLAGMLDMEHSVGDNIQWNAGSANPFVREFIRLYREMSGQARVIVYGNLDFYANILRPDEWADDDVFLELALFNGQPGDTDWYYHRRLAVHQHTERGNIPGFAGFADRWCTLPAYDLAALTHGGLAPAPAPQPAPGGPVTPGGWVDYLVQPGDTLSVIAAARDTSVDELVRVNSITNPNLIYVGQVLRVPAGGALYGGQYRVQPGDTLSEIAQRHGITLAALLSANPDIVNPDLIYAGQWLDVPTNNVPQPPPVAPVVESYTVASGDTLSGIARRFGTTVAALVDLNGIANPDYIQAGWTLRIR